MATNRKKITITIPKELDKIIDTLVEESKETAEPLSKSGFIADSVMYFLHNCLNILDSQKHQKKEEN